MALFEREQDEFASTPAPVRCRPSRLRTTSLPGSTRDRQELRHFFGRSLNAGRMLAYRQMDISPVTASSRWVSARG
jgi:hypothetical protein